MQGIGKFLARIWDAKGTNTVKFLTHEEIRRIPPDRTVTYARIVIDYRPQKDDPNRVRITVGGNLIDYPDELSTRTADLTTTQNPVEKRHQHARCKVHVR